VNAGVALVREPRAARCRYGHGLGVTSALVALFFSGACASSGARAFAPMPAARAARALEAWNAAASRPESRGDANLLYDAALSQGLLSNHGTLAVRLRGELVEGTLAGPFGSPIATYVNGELRGEKLQPVRLPPQELRAVLAGTWSGEAPAVVGESGAQVLLRWAGEEPVDGVFDVGRGELISLRIQRPEGELEARFSGSRSPWPDRIDIEEKRTGSKLRLRLLSREAAP
jgi:hypothetical protein